VVPMTEEERYGRVLGCGSEDQVDGAVPGREDGVEAIGVVAVWTRRHRIGRRKFWQSNG
jgi:hypothetical protein